MEWTTRLSWLSGAAQVDEPADPDCAGMGTAFGLDASIPPADAFDLCDAPSPPSWERRLVRRSEL